MRLLQSIFTFDEIQCCLITTIIYIWPLKKRSHLKERIALSFVTAVLAIPLIDMYHMFTISVFPDNIMSQSRQTDLGVFLFFSGLGLLLALLLLFLIFLICCDIAPSHALYGAICAYITQDLAYTVFTFCMPQAAHRGLHPILPKALLFEFLICGIVYSLISKQVAKALPYRGDYRFNCLQLILLLLPLMLASRLLMSYVSAIFDTKYSSLFSFYMLYNTLVYSALLFIQGIFKQNDVYRNLAESEQKLRQQKEQEYIRFRNNLDSINHKCHDIRHLFEAFQYEEDNIRKNDLFTELKKEILIYDSHMHTGNDALDAILARTWLRCNDLSIQWTCMADGKALLFMDPVDLYVFLGNAFDNAIENTNKIADPEKRILNVSIWSKGNMAFVRIENSYEGTVSLKNGLPQTTKRDQFSHGYGTKSIQNIVNAYNGEMQINTENSVFTLSCVFPGFENDTPVTKESEK